MKRLLLLSLVIWGCCACFSDLGRPEPTEAGWKLFGYVDAVFGMDRMAAMRAAQLDEYCRQTTDEGRREVHDCYFPRERIVSDGNVWQVVSTQSIWTFEFIDGISLTMPDAEWKVSYKMDGLDQTTVVMINSGDGALLLKSQMEQRRFSTFSELRFRVVQSADAQLALEFLSGKGSLLGQDVPQLDLAYVISEPVTQIWSDTTPCSGGVIGIKAYNQADGADEEVTASYLGDGNVRIVYMDRTGTWSLENYVMP